MEKTAYYAQINEIYNVSNFIYAGASLLKISLEGILTIHISVITFSQHENLSQHVIFNVLCPGSIRFDILGRENQFILLYLGRYISEKQVSCQCHTTNRGFRVISNALSSSSKKELKLSSERTIY